MSFRCGVAEEDLAKPVDCDRDRRGQVTQELDLLAAELLANPVQDIERGGARTGLGQLAVAVAAQPDRALAKPVETHEGLRRERSVHVITTKDDRRVLRHFREDSVQRRQVGVNVVQRRNSHSSDDLAQRRRTSVELYGTPQR